MVIVCLDFLYLSRPNQSIAILFSIRRDHFNKTTFSLITGVPTVSSLEAFTSFVEKSQACSGQLGTKLSCRAYFFGCRTSSKVVSGTSSNPLYIQFINYVQLSTSFYFWPSSTKITNKPQLASRTSLHIPLLWQYLYTYVIALKYQ